MDVKRPPFALRVTVFLLHDHELFRLGLRTLLESQTTMRVAGEAATAAEALERVAALRPALVITGARLADGDAAEVCRRASVAAPGTRVAVLTGGADEAAILALTRAGAAACLPADMRADELCRAIRALAAGDGRPGPHVRPALLPPPRRPNGARDDLFTLTPQERRVLALVVEGKTNKEIAVSLALSDKTVKNYLSNAFEKLQVSRRAQAAVLFARQLSRARVTRPRVVAAAPPEAAPYGETA